MVINRLMTQVSLQNLIAGAIAGKVISFPTDTVPALAVKPELAELIFTLKQRPLHKPLILMAAAIEDFAPYIDFAQEQPANVWRQTIAKYLPGAITFILPATTQVPKVINPLNPTTVGIRIPANHIACQILQQTGVLATTSANISGAESLTDLREIARVFPEVLVLEDSELSKQDKIGSGMPSTVAKWTDGKWTILRQGSVEIPDAHQELT